jgi:hypothetical protein
VELMMDTHNQLMRRSILVLALSVSSVSAAGCDEQTDTWVKAVKDCGITGVNPANTLYFGPSNNVGPGSGWRETFGQNRKHVDYRLRLDDEELPTPKAFIRLSPSGYQCKGGREVNFQLNIMVAANSSTLPLSAELSNDLKWATNIRVTVGGMVWDELNELDYEEYFKKTLGAGNKYYEDMNVPERLVLLRALAVKDLVMVYEFSQENAAALKAKYTGPLGGKSKGDIGAGLSADWHQGNNLAITAPGQVWVLGELVPFRSSTGFAAAGPRDRRAALKIVPESEIVAENANQLTPSFAVGVGTLKINMRFHYSANSSEGGWSSTNTVSSSGAITIGPQAMEGNLLVRSGDTLRAGYDFTMPGSHPSAGLIFSQTAVTFQAACASGKGGDTIVVRMAAQSYSDPQDSSAWYPSSDQQASAVYQGSATVPDVCGGGTITLSQGGTFRATVGSSTRRAR